MAEGGTRQKPGSRLALKPAFYSTLCWFLASAWMGDSPLLTHGYLQDCHGVACAVPKYLNSSSHPPQDWEPQTHVHRAQQDYLYLLKCVWGIREYQFLDSIWLKTFQNPHFQSPTIWMHHPSPQCWVCQGNKSYLGPSYEILWTILRWCQPSDRHGTKPWLSSEVTVPKEKLKYTEGCRLGGCRGSSHFCTP